MKSLTTLEEFERLRQLRGSRVLTVLFTAKWCKPCSQLAPKYKDLEHHHQHAVMTIVDVDEGPDIAEECAVSGLPTVQFYMNGEKIHEVTGLNVPKLQEAFQKYVPE